MQRVEVLTHPTGLDLLGHRTYQALLMVRQDSKHWEYSSKEDQASAQILQEHQTLSQGTSEVAKQWAGGLWGQFDEL